MKNLMILGALIFSLPAFADSSATEKVACGMSQVLLNSKDLKPLYDEMFAKSQALNASKKQRLENFNSEILSATRTRLLNDKDFIALVNLDGKYLALSHEEEKFLDHPKAKQMEPKCIDEDVKAPDDLKKFCESLHKIRGAKAELLHQAFQLKAVYKYGDQSLLRLMDTYAPLRSYIRDMILEVGPRYSHEEKAGYKFRLSGSGFFKEVPHTLHAELEYFDNTLKLCGAEFEKNGNEQVLCSELGLTKDSVTHAWSDVSPGCFSENKTKLLCYDSKGELESFQAFQARFVEGCERKSVSTAGVSVDEKKSSVEVSQASESPRLPGVQRSVLFVRRLK